MTSFFSRLETRARAINSLLCVGLDPHPADLAAPTAAAARDFCLRLIDGDRRCGRGVQTQRGLLRAVRRRRAWPRCGM